MKKHFCLLLIFVITGIISGAGACPEAVGPSEIETISVKKLIKVDLPRPFFRLEGVFKVTNYIPEKDALTSTGERVDPKKNIVAVNPKEIPFGSKIRFPDIPGVEFTANDTIGEKGIKAGVKFDICRPWNFSQETAKEFGGKMRKVIVIIKPLAG